MSDDGCDTKIYERLNDLERDADRSDERVKHVEEFTKEVKQDIKILSTKVTVSEVRMVVVIGILIWVANRFFH